MKKYLSAIAMTLVMTCTVTACGANKSSDVSSKENVSESMSELADSSDKAVYDTYEEALDGVVVKTSVILMSDISAICYRYISIEDFTG